MAWTNLTFAFGSVLTSAKMTQLFDNLAAMSNGDAGSPTNLALQNKANIMTANQRINAGLGVNITPPATGDFAISGSMTAGVVPLARIDGGANSIQNNFGILAGVSSTHAAVAVTVSGAALGDFVLVSTDQNIDVRYILTGRVTAVNTVTVYLFNTGQTIDPPAIDFNVKVIKK